MRFPIEVCQILIAVRQPVLITLSLSIHFQMLCYAWLSISLLVLFLTPEQEVFGLEEDEK